MDIFSKKPSNQDNVTRDSVSNDTSTQPVVTQPLQPPTQQPVDQPVVKKEKHSRAFSFVSILFLLTLLGAGFLAYLWYNQSADVDSLNREITQAKAEQDMLKKQIVVLKKDDSTVVATGTTPKSDAESINTALTAYYHVTDKSNAGAKVTTKVNKQVESFANVTLNVDGQYKAGCLLKNSDDTWVVLHCGTGAPQTVDVERWGAPQAVIVVN